MSVGVDIKDIVKEFHTDSGIRRPLDGFSLRVADKQHVTVIGRSGSGKTTLLKVVCGLEKADHGKVEFFNAHGKKVKDPHISFVFQEPRLLPWKTVGQNLELAIREEPEKERQRKIRDVLDLVCLGQIQSLYPSQLSGGMAQRVGLARGIISKPDLLLLDEPFSSLDYMTRAKLQLDFSNMEAELSMTMLMITHDINEAVFLSNEVVYLDDGKAAKKMEINVPMPRQLGDPKLLPYQNELLTYILRNTT